MKLTIDGTPEEIKKMLNTICGSEEHRCLLCNQNATLQLENKNWICEECAFVMNDIGIEND